MSQRINTNLLDHISSILIDALGDDFDADTFWDTLDGETDVLDIVDRVIANMRNDAALADAAKSQADALATRAKRLSDRQNAHKAALLAVLDATGQKKLERPAATISRRKGVESVRIMDEEDIPSQLMIVKTSKSPDRTAIKKQIQSGETVPGADLVRGPDGVTVRVL